MVVESGVYNPPKAGLPYLAVVIVDGEMTVLPAETPLEASRLLRDDLKPDAKARRLLNNHYGKPSSKPSR